MRENSKAVFSFYKIGLAQKEADCHHQAKADQKGVGCPTLFTVGVGFGDHFIADNVKHRTACKGKCKGQNGNRNFHGKVANERADDFYKPCGEGDEKGALFAHPRG